MEKAGPNMGIYGDSYIAGTIRVGFSRIIDKLREKLDGINIREKFRIRYYNGDTSYIHLEKKSKIRKKFGSFV